MQYISAPIREHGSLCVAGRQGLRWTTIAYSSLFKVKSRPALFSMDLGICLRLISPDGAETVLRKMIERTYAGQ